MVFDFVRRSRMPAKNTVGIILGISWRTVEKHIEHILERLGVETRTAAAAVALKTANL